MSDEIGALALEAQQRLGGDDPAAAVAILTDTLARDVSNYERFMLLNLRADASYRLDDIAGAIGDWQSMLELGVARPEEAASLGVNIGQLMILDDRVDEGVAVLEAWLAENTPRENIVFMLATALASEQEYSRSLTYAALAEELATPVEQKHLDLLHFLYDRLEMPEQKEETLRRMETLPRRTLSAPG